MTDKATLRVAARAKLAALTPDVRAQHGATIAEHLWTLPEVADARTLLLYADLTEEVPTAAIAGEARRRGIEVIYPRCLPGGREMSLHQVGSEAELKVGSYNIREPGDDCPITTAAGLDVALLPGLAFDDTGHRLGRGAGYYDRLLAAPDWRAVTVGLFFAAQQVESIPADPWDRPLDLVVTETAIHRFDQRK